MAINNITQTISTIPEAAHRGVDVQTVFVIKQEDFQDHLQGTTVTELNTLKDQLNSRIGEINSTATTMNGYADTASTGASTATTKAGEASTSASEALTSRNQAETFKNSASVSATKASQWADNNYNVEVETGKYSAKHWATVAQSASGEDIKGSDIASASTTIIGTAGLGDYIHITGTVTITSFGTAANEGLRRTLIFDDALTLTNGANLICVGGANIVTVANTIVSVVAETITQWRIEYVIHPSVSFAELGYLDGVTSNIQNQINNKANIVSPTFTGIPTAPTPTAQDNSTKVATTAYVDGKMVLGTAVNSTSGTSIDFTGIPSWAKKVRIMLQNISLSGSSSIVVQLGSTTIKTSAYNASASNSINGTFPLIISASNGFMIINDVSTDALNAIMDITYFSNNIYMSKHTRGGTTGRTTVGNGAGTVTLDGLLDRIRITTVNGTDTFDAGKINILYEG